MRREVYIYVEGSEALVARTGARTAAGVNAYLNKLLS